MGMAGWRGVGRGSARARQMLLAGNNQAGGDGGGGPPPPEDEPWTGYFAAAGITNATAKSAINAFHDGLATDGIQSKVKAFVLLGAESATAKNVMADAYHGSLVNSPTFTQWAGVRCDGVTNYINTGTALNAITGVSQNSLCIGVGAAVDTPASGDATDPNLLVAFGATEYTSQQPRFDNIADAAEYFIYANVNDDYSAAASTPVAWGTLSAVRVYSSRTGASALKSFYGATEVTSQAIASTGIPAYAMFLGASNNAGTPSFNSEDDRFVAKWYMIAEGLSAAEIALFNTRVATLEAALEAL